ncbi:MAG: right-handed parallel beta-helix repeat-containing protein [Candidatus Bathyarchaeota archaeon]|nr:right-handed parallel beta-helix repeat-containing protein [Candidatus Bathyarchaeota archaeon]
MMNVSKNLKFFVPALFIIMILFPATPDVKGHVTVIINADGTVDGTNLFQVSGETYRFTDNINAPIIVKKDNTIIDGAGFVLQGDGVGTGIELKLRNNVTVRNATITNFNLAVNLWEATKITLSNNSFIENNRSLSVSTIADPQLSTFMHDIDDSNRVNDKPIYYLVNRQDMTVPLDAGEIVLINCTRMIIQSINLTNNEHGILLVYTTNSLIVNNCITNAMEGVSLWESHNNTIVENQITESSEGIYLRSAQNNTVLGNNITNNWSGIRLEDSSIATIIGNNLFNNTRAIYCYFSSTNTIASNNIERNSCGIYFVTSSFSIFYANNFTENIQIVDDMYGTVPSNALKPSVNFWDNGKEGNYWSDYQVKYPDASETDNTDIWNTPYVINVNNTDNYPLVNPPYTSSVTPAPIPSPSIPEFTALTIIFTICALTTIITLKVALYKNKQPK